MNITSMKETLQFLSELNKNNNREWFAENKTRYQNIRAKIENVTAELVSRLVEIEPDVAGMQPQECLYRIYRDTRFSPDKTPYKRHIGIYINPHGGKKSQLGGYYLHIEPGKCIVGGGLWCPPMEILKAVRRSIYENVDEYLEIIRDPEFRKYYQEVGEDLLKTAPKGFPKDWEHIDLLKPRSFTVLGKITDRAVTSYNMAEKVMEYFRAMKPYNDFVNYVFEEDPGLPRFF